MSSGSTTVNLFKSSNSFLPKSLNAKDNVGDLVLYNVDGICDRQGIKITGVLMPLVKKMPMAALQGKTIGQLVKTTDHLDYGPINYNIGVFCQAFLPLLFIIRIYRQIFRFCECFQLCYSC